MTTQQSTISNRLLTSLLPSDFALLKPHLEYRNFPLKHYIERAHQPITHVFFPESAIASTVAKSPEDRDVEINLTGWEGMTGTALVLGKDTTALETYIQIAGGGYVLPSHILSAALETSDTLEKKLLSYIHTLVIQSASTALVNGLATAETRLARWLLMLHDRTTRSDISITHEFIAVMLAMRRPWVTETLHVLEGKQLIRSLRGNVKVLDREGLIVEAKGYYGMAEAEYESIMAPPDTLPRGPDLRLVKEG
jgi:CRP-like cAMP-binding protein